MPHSFVFAILLTIIAFLLALVLTPSSPFGIVLEWSNEFWGFLEFAMQLVIIVVTGYGIATASVVRRKMTQLARIPTTPLQAYVSVVIFSFLIALVHWGLGLVGAGFYAIFIAKERSDIDFGFTVAIAYSAGITGAAGSISQSAPLFVNTPGHFMEDQIGLIPLSQTIFSPFHLAVVWGAFFVLLVITYLIRPPEDEIEPLTSDEVDELLPEYELTTESSTVAARFDGSRAFNATIVLLGGTFIGWLITTEGVFGALELNSMNLIFIVLGVALHGSVVSYAKAITDGAQRAGQIILQFPFYGGIQGILLGTGLSVFFIDAITSTASSDTLPFFVWFITGMINIFVPSGGGQYIVTADILHSVADDMGVSHAVIVSAYTVGDSWTNLLQPFWALPILGIVGLRVRDIWGYVIMALIGYGIVAAIITLTFPLIGLI